MAYDIKSPTVYSLNDLISKSVEGNARVASGQYRASAADNALQSAWQNYLPTPGVSYNKGDDGRDETVLSLQQPLWAGGRLDAGVDAADAKAKSAASNITEEQYRLSLTVIDNYQKYVQSMTRQEALKRFTYRLSIYKGRMENRVASGASPANDMALLQARIATASAQLTAAQAQGEMALTQLSQLANLALDNNSVRISEETHNLEPLITIVAQAKASNPTLRRLDHDIAQAEAEVRIQRSTMMPTVSVVLKHSMYHGSNLPDDDTSINLQVQLQSGPGLSAYTNTQAAQAQAQALRWTQEATMQELEANIRSDYENLISVIRRQADVEQNASSAAGVLESYERLFIAGKRSWMDVMNAARDLSDADIAVADNKAEKLGAMYRMDLYSAKYKWLEKGF
jgi:adhesin transport system outer membrane protein